MEVCKEKHDFNNEYHHEIAYDDNTNAACPLCDAIKEMEKMQEEIDLLKEKIDTLNSDIDDKDQKILALEEEKTTERESEHIDNRTDNHE